jgi:hypothetical protein
MMITSMIEPTAMSRKLLRSVIGGVALVGP